MAEDDFDLDAFLEEQDRLWDQRDREHYEKRTREAIELGFASLEDQRQHEFDEECRKIAEYRRKLPEKLAAAGQTLKEYMAALTAGQVPIPPTPLPSFSQCDCDKHAPPTFCPAKLLNFRSQDREDFDEFEEQNRTRIETLTIKPGEKSKRLEPEALERAWDAEIYSLPMPYWARAHPDFLAMQRIHTPDTPSRTSPPPSFSPTMPKSSTSISEKRCHTSKDATYSRPSQGTRSHETSDHDGNLKRA